MISSLLHFSKFFSSVFSHCLFMEAHQNSTADSQSSMSLNKKLIPKSPTCFYDPSTCQRQSFSIPEKIVFYIAKNCTNGETFKKLAETCKYFFKVNPVIVVPHIKCYDHEWVACYGEDGEYRVGFKYGQQINGKIWVTQNFSCFFGDASQLIPSIYKNDATGVRLRNKPLKFEGLLFLACNAEELSMWHQVVEYENGEVVQLEDIVKNLPKLKHLYFVSNDGYDFNTNTAERLMEIEHFKNITTYLDLRRVPETLNVETMFNFIIENQDVYVSLCYRQEISDDYKELVREYSNQLQIEEGCNSRIEFYGMGWDASEDDSSDASLGSFDDNISDSFDDEDFLFPWNTEDDEEWELPWDI